MIINFQFDLNTIVGTALYAYSSDRGSILSLLPHTAPTEEAVCVSDLRIKLPGSLCVGMMHMIFLGLSKDTHTTRIFQLTPLITY